MASNPPWPAAAYRKTLHRLTGPAYRAFARATAGSRVGDTVHAGAALAGWATDLLLGALADPAAALGFLEWAAGPLQDAGLALALDPDGRPPFLSVTAGRYVGLTGLAGCYDAETGEPVADADELRAVAETSLQNTLYNLRVLFLAQSERLCSTNPPPPSGGPTTATPPPS